MFSNEETICPQNVTKWVNDDSAKLSCISQSATNQGDVAVTAISGKFDTDDHQNLKEFSCKFARKN